MGSDNWYFRRKIPADVQRILASLPKDQRPAGWYKTHISISLGTADRNEAKAKCPEVAAAVERQIEAFRNGPKPLTPKQIAALSGLLYRAFAEGLEEDPVLTPEQWRDIAGSNAARFAREKANLQAVHGTAGFQVPAYSPWYRRGGVDLFPQWLNAVPPPR
jgi:hypothetical protein